MEGFGPPFFGANMGTRQIRDHAVTTHTDDSGVELHGHVDEGWKSVFDAETGLFHSEPDDDREFDGTRFSRKKIAKKKKKKK